MEEAEAPLRTLEALRAMGVRLALDDFGTGYSSLSYLRRFALDALKVDRSFVSDLESDPHATPLVEAVVAMASALGLAVVAEGIESETQRAQLAALGCRYGQGVPARAPAGRRPSCTSRAPLRRFRVTDVVARCPRRADRARGGATPLGGPLESRRRPGRTRRTAAP
jgi:EAL domain-containing protein (putative c-di-GMP-specific phosphodiesterase class I)